MCVYFVDVEVWNIYTFQTIKGFADKLYCTKVENRVWEL